MRNALFKEEQCRMIPVAMLHFYLKDCKVNSYRCISWLCIKKTKHNLEEYMKLWVKIQLMNPKNLPLVKGLLRVVLQHHCPDSVWLNFVTLYAETLTPSRHCNKYFVSWFCLNHTLPKHSSTQSELGKLLEQQWRGGWTLNGCVNSFTFENCSGEVVFVFSRLTVVT